MPRSFSHTQVIFRRMHYLPGGAKGEISATLRKIAVEADLKQPGYRIRIAALCTEIVIFTARKLSQYENYDNDPVTTLVQSDIIIRRAMEYMEENYATPISLEDIARHVDRSTEHLSRLYKKVTGLTMMAQLQDLRLHKALDLILTTALTVTQVAHRCGFTTPNYFCRVFKHKFNQSPMAYRTSRSIQSQFSPSSYDPPVKR
jgi:AraC-like DNA-binding protein